MSTIADALVSLGVSGYSLAGEPTTEAEFKAAFTGSTDKTWAEIKAEKERIAYISKREAAYDTLPNQLDLLWHAIDADADLKVKFASFYNSIKAVKDANPKP